MGSTIWGGAAVIVSSQKQLVYTAVGSEGQTVVNSFTPAGLSYEVGTGQITVFVNGVLQTLGVNYTETSINSIAFLAALEPGDNITVLKRVY